MGVWLKITTYLSIIGFLREFRPSEAFFVAFVTGEWKKFSVEDINKYIFPIATYSNAFFLVIMFFISDICRYKPLIVLMGLAGVSSSALLILCNQLFHIVLAQVFYGLFMATEIAYQSYIYANIMAEDYQRVTGLLKAARLAGKLCSGLISQLLVSFNFMNFMQLNYITFISLCLVTLTSIKLPNGQKRLSTRNDGAELSLNDDQENIATKVKTISTRFGEHLNQFSVNRTLQILSAFWVINLAMYLQIGTYSQSLWQEVAKESNTHIYNGLVDAISKAVGIIGSLFATVIKIDFEKKGSILILFLWFIQGSLLVVTSYTIHLYINYICSIIYSVIYQFLITILTSEIAKCILSDSYGLVFSTNTFLSLTLQMVLISLIVKNSFLAHLSIRSHFFLYGTIHFVLALAIIFIIIVNAICVCLKKSRKNNIDNKQVTKYTFDASKCVIETEIF